MTDRPDRPRRRWPLQVLPVPGRRGYVPVSQRLDPGGDGSPVLYAHGFMLGVLLPGLLVFLVIGLPAYALLWMGPAVSPTARVASLLMVAVFAVLGPFALQMHISRPVRAVTVDGAGLWVAGELVAPADRIVAAGPCGKPKHTSRVHLGDTWGWTRLHDVPTVGPVAIPTWFDSTVNHISEVPAVLVVTDERLGPARLAWTVVSWRRRSLVGALVAVTAPDTVVAGLDRGPRIDPDVRQRLLDRHGIEGQRWRGRIR